MKSFVVFTGRVCDQVHKQRGDCRSYTEHRTDEHNCRYTTTSKACGYFSGNFISIYRVVVIILHTPYII